MSSRGGGEDGGDCGTSAMGLAWGGFAASAAGVQIEVGSDLSE